jgi:hypothetical protein
MQTTPDDQERRRPRRPMPPEVRKDLDRRNCEKRHLAQANAEAARIAEEARAIFLSPDPWPWSQPRPTFSLDGLRLYLHDDVAAPRGFGTPHEHDVRVLLYVLAEFLRSRGWTVTREHAGDPREDMLSPWILALRKGRLGGSLRGFSGLPELEFWRLAAAGDDPFDDRHERREFGKAPPLQRLDLLVEIAAVAGYVQRRCGFAPDCHWPAGLPLPLQVREAILGLRARKDIRAWVCEDHCRGFGRAAGDGEWPVLHETRRDGQGNPVAYGDVRYFRHEGRLVRAQVYPRGGAYWMTLAGGEEVYAEPQELFDCARPDLEPRRAFPSHEVRNRLAREKKKAVEAEDYERAAVLRDLLRRRPPASRCFVPVLAGLPAPGAEPLPTLGRDPARIGWDEFTARCREQGVPREHVAFRCVVCGTVQSVASLEAAGLDPEDAEQTVGFSCVGRKTGAGPWDPKREGRDRRPGCDWTLGGLFAIHDLEITGPGGGTRASFRLATPAAARQLMQALAVDPKTPGLPAALADGGKELPSRGT